MSLRFSRDVGSGLRLLAALCACASVLVCTPVFGETEALAITDVLVSPGPSSAHVFVQLSKRVKYSCRETDAPPGLIVEVPGAESKMPSGAIRIGRDPIRQFTVFPSEGGKPARVEIVFSAKARWSVSEELGGRRIAIEVKTGNELQPRLSASDSAPATRRSPSASSVSLTSPPDTSGGVSTTKRAQAGTARDDSLDCSFKDTDIHDVIQVIADLVGANIVADASVQGKVTLNLSKIGWKEGLGTALRSLGYSLQEDGGVYTVSKSAPENIPTVSVDDGKLRLSATQVDIKGLLAAVSEKSGLNIVTSPSVDGKVSVQLAGVDVEDGLYTFLSANGYSFRKLQDIYVVDKLEAGKSKPALRPYKRTTAGKITIDFKDAELAEILSELANQTGKNIVTYGQLPEKINIRLVDVTLEEALRLVLAGTKYSSRKMAEVYVVGDATNLASPVAQMLTVTEIVGLKYIRAEECPKYLSAVVPAANIKALKEQNSLLVVGTEEMVSRVKQEIDLIDRVAPQVMIEAQVVEVSENVTKNLGLDLQWASGTLSVKLPGVGQAAYDSKGAYPNNLIVALQALVCEGKAHVLANPKVCTVSGKEANITIAQQRYFRTGYIPTNGDNQNNNNPPAYYYPYSQVQSVEAGILLRIVPFVGASEEITVDIEPEVSNVTGTGPDGLPEISRRKASTTVRVKNGETIVIGGLKQREESKSTTRTPILSSIPMIGGLFRSHTKNAREADLMILITPRLITGTDVQLSSDNEQSETRPRLNGDSSTESKAERAKTEKPSGERGDAR